LKDKKKRGLENVANGCSYGSEMWSVALREEHRLRVYKNRVPRGVFRRRRKEVTGGWRTKKWEVTGGRKSKRWEITGGWRIRK
jgi:hypothetical protein